MSRALASAADKMQRRVLERRSAYGHCVLGRSRWGRRATPPSAARSLVLSGGWLLALSCGSRTGLPPGRVLAEGDAGAPPVMTVECTVAAECPQPPPGHCGEARCSENRCELTLAQVCDDGDPCTVDVCEARQCVHTDGHVDADGDGVFARG